MEQKITIPDGYVLKQISETEYKIVKKEEELVSSWEEFCEKYPIKIKERYVGNGSCIGKFSEKFDRISDNDRNVLPNKEKAEAILALCQLIQLRDCYNDGWTPNWQYVQNAYCIVYQYGEWEKGLCSFTAEIFCFKTEKLCDKFFENFKDLLEKVKPLYY